MMSPRIIVFAMLLLTNACGTPTRPSPHRPESEVKTDDLGANDPAEREAALQRLVAAGSRSRPALIMAQSSGDPEIASRASEALRQIEIAEENEQCNRWKEKVREIQSSWGRVELEEFSSRNRVSSPLEPARLVGGAFSTNSEPETYFDLYSLDETYSLYVIWKGQDVRKGIRSTEVVGFSDLRKQIDPDLFRGVNAIHRAPSAKENLRFNSVPLIRAVNTLQLLGRENAVRALWAYYRLARSLAWEEAIKYSVDEFRILPIIQLLFDSPKKPFPLGAGDARSPEGNAWPLFPMVEEQHVPFIMVNGYTCFGQPPDAADHFKYAEGPLRSRPLCPPILPLEAADILCSSEPWQHLGMAPDEELQKRWDIRWQAIRALRPIFEPLPRELSTDCCAKPTEAQWRAMVERATSYGIVWNAERQEFVRTR